MLRGVDTLVIDVQPAGGNDTSENGGGGEIYGVVEIRVFIVFNKVEREVALISDVFLYAGVLVDNNFGQVFICYFFRYTFDDKHRFQCSGRFRSDFTVDVGIGTEEGQVSLLSVVELYPDFTVR